MADPVLPPIPARCADQPTAGGLVVPHISVVADGRPALGSVHHRKAMACIVDSLCQICGKRLTRPLVVLVSDRNLQQRYSPEPALHPECAAYSMRACPMLAGRQTRYRHQDKHIGTGCDKPGCDCGGWTPTPGNNPASLRGQPADRWWAVWLDDYQIALNDQRQVHGLAWLHVEPLKTRPVPATHTQEVADA